ncbi:MAG: DUF1292 domain-containing protein [Moorellales bacterium]
MNESDTIVLMDDEGEEHEFMVVDFLEVGEKEYVVLLPLDEEEEEDEGEAVVFRLELDEQGEEVLREIEDDEEWEAVERAWEKAMAQEEE